MSNPTTNALEIQILKDALALLISNSVEPKDGTKTTTTTDDTLFPVQNIGEPVTFVRKGDFIVALLGGIRRISDTNSEVSAVGQLVMGRKTGINGGFFFIGYVTFFPPTQDSHINFQYQS